MMKWQVMHPFHKCIASQLFPHGHQTTTDMSEELVLMWTTLQPTLDMPWRHTYVWNGQLDGLIKAIDDSKLQSTYWQFSKFFQGAISKALWNAPTTHQPVPKLQFVWLHHTIQSAHVSPTSSPLNNPLVACHMEPQHLQPQTGYQRWATLQTQYSPGHNCDNCRNTAALPASHMQKNMAYDQVPQHPAEWAKQHTPDTVLGESPGGLLVVILTFLGQNMGGSHFTAENPKQSSTGFTSWFHWWLVRKILQHLQSGVNVGLQPFYSISGIQHGTSLLTRMLRTVWHGPGQPILFSCPGISFSLTSGWVHL